MENKEKEELFIEKDRFKFIRILIFIILIGILGYGIYLLYQKKFVDNKSIITEIIEEKQENIGKIIEKEQKNTIYKYNGTINLDIELIDKEREINDVFKDININIEGETDLKNKINNTLITTKYENDDLIKFNIYEQDNKSYLYLQDYYDKYIEIDETNNTSNYDPNDLKVILDTFYEEVNKIIQNNKLTESNETITIKDKKINTKKNSLVLKDKQINDTLISIYKDLKNNKDFVNILKKYNPDILDTIDESINDLSNNPYIDDEVTINLYLTSSILNKNIIRYEIIFKSLDLKLIIDNPDNDTHILSINTKELNLNIELGKKLLNIDFKINSEEIKINLTANFNMEPIKEVTKKEITNTIKLEDLKDDDINTITENMGANNSLNNLITHIAGIEARNEV